jgi:hypothetical protein
MQSDSTPVWLAKPSSRCGRIALALYHSGISPLKNLPLSALVGEGGTAGEWMDV